MAFEFGKGIRDKLITDSVNGGVRIFFEFVPAETNEPYVVIRLVDSRVMAEDSADVYHEAWQVTVVGRVASAVRTVTDAIHTSLNDQAVDGGTGYTFLWSKLDNFMFIHGMLGDKPIYTSHSDFKLMRANKVS